MKKLSLLLCFFFIIFAGCTRDTSSDDSASTVDTSSSTVISEGNANIEVTDIRKLTTTPKVVVFFKNSGTATAYDLSCVVRAMKNNIVLETIAVELTDLPDLTLEVDDESLLDFTFETVTSNTDYDELQFDFNWNEAYEGNITLRLFSISK